MVYDGVVHHAPGSVTTLARTRLLGTRDKVALVGLLRRLPKTRPASLAGTNVTAWLDDGTDRQRVRQIIQAIVRLTSYVNGPDHLSAEVAVLQLQLGLGEGVLYLDGGWEQLVERLRATVGVRIVTGEPITTLEQLPGAGAVIVATGSPGSVADLVGHRFMCGPAATAGVLDLGLKAPPEIPFIVGVDEPRYLSNHGVAAQMVPEGAASVSLAEYHDVGAPPDAEEGASASAARDRLRRFASYAGVGGEQIVEERYLHRMTVVTSLATADDGGLDSRPVVKVPDRDGVFVAGDWVGRRGHLADAVVASAEEAALAAVRHVQRRPVLL